MKILIVLNFAIYIYLQFQRIKKEGVIINTERRASKVNPVIPKEEGELSDFEIFYNIGKELGMGDLLNGWETPRSTFELLKKCSKGMPCDITGITYEMLEGPNMEGSRGVQWPFREGETLIEDERRLYEDGNYYTPSKKAKFHFEDIAENPIQTSKEFPYIFNSGRGVMDNGILELDQEKLKHQKEFILRNLMYLCIQN